MEQFDLKLSVMSAYLSTVLFPWLKSKSYENVIFQIDIIQDIFLCEIIKRIYQTNHILVYFGSVYFTRSGSNLKDIQPDSEETPILLFLYYLGQHQLQLYVFICVKRNLTYKMPTLGKSFLKVNDFFFFSDFEKICEISVMQKRQTIFQS